MKTIKWNNNNNRYRPALKRFLAAAFTGLVNFIPIFFSVADAFVADSVSNEITLANVRDYSTILNVIPYFFSFSLSLALPLSMAIYLRRRIGSLGVYGSGGGNFSLFITYLFY